MYKRVLVSCINWSLPPQPASIKSVPFAKVYIVIKSCRPLLPLDAVQSLVLKSPCSQTGLGALRPWTSSHLSQMKSDGQAESLCMHVGEPNNLASPCL